jgi:hypothetical protein
LPASSKAQQAATPPTVAALQVDICSDEEERLPISTPHVQVWVVELVSRQPTFGLD